jgi:hypothetical protein
MSSQGEDTNRQSNTHPFRAAGIWSAQANFTLSSKLYLADSRPSWKVFFCGKKYDNHNTTTKMDEIIHISGHSLVVSR